MRYEITADQYRELEHTVENRMDQNLSLHPTYSGRGMYGQMCFGISGHIDALDARDILVDALGDDQLVDLIVESRTTDQLGLGAIVYFPGIGVAEDALNDDKYA